MRAHGRRNFPGRPFWKFILAIVRVVPGVAKSIQPPPAMNHRECEMQLQTDCELLRGLVAGLDRLEQHWNDARISVQARQRGYFTPDEDDQVRQMLLTYRNYRRALYELIERHATYADRAEPTQQLRGFMVAFAAALTLYERSLKLIQYYEHAPLVRKKLNEPDAKFELEAGFFDELLTAFSSLENYRLLARANRSWRQQRGAIQRSPLAGTPDWAWLCTLIRQQRTVLSRRFRSVLWMRLRHDWRALWQLTLQPLVQTRYGLQSLLGGAFAGMRTTRHYTPGIDAAVLKHLRSVLRPGDVLLIRAERKVTTVLLPGFWAHAALYLGGPGDLKSLRLDLQPAVQKHWASIPPDGGRYGQVLEAIAPRVLINPLERSLFADHVAVLRPNISPTDLAASLTEAFGHLGKPFDFEFDFNVTTRIVCTELVYRAFHRRAGIEFKLVKRLGRYTLTCDDIMNLFLASADENPGAARAPFQLVTLALKLGGERSQLIPVHAAVECLRRIRNGDRPVSTEDFLQPEQVAFHD